MREIKFRAWDEKKKAWLTCSQLTHITSTEGGSHQTDVLMMEPCEHLGNIAVEQFTGLLDKNGKEIYEGDIVQYQDYNTSDRTWKVANVYWMNWADWANVPFLHPFGSPTSGKDLEDGRSTGTHFITPPNVCEVIGNIHENPDLLK